MCGAIAYPRHLDYAAFREIADEVDAYLIADAAHTLGLVAGGAAPSPVPYADVVCATTHKALRGPRGGLILCGEELAERIDRAVFPFIAGRPAHARRRRQGGGVRRGRRPRRSPRTPARWSPTRGRWPRSSPAEGMRPVLTGGTDTHLITADLAPRA